MKIAPVLQALAKEEAAFWPTAVQVELRAMLAVLRVVEKQGPLESAVMDIKLGRAWARLEKVSKP